MIFIIVDCQGLGKGETEELLFNGHRVLVLQDKKEFWILVAHNVNVFNDTEMYI